MASNIRIVSASVFDLYRAGKVVALPTNGHTSYAGVATMERGQAFGLAKEMPDVPMRLGKAIKKNGHIVQEIKPRLVSFPWKPAEFTSAGDDIVSPHDLRYGEGDVLPGSMRKPDLAMAMQSFEQLNALRKEMKWRQVYLPLSKAMAEHLAGSVPQYRTWLRFVTDA